MARRPRARFRERWQASRLIMGQSFRFTMLERDLWAFPILSAILFVPIVGVASAVVYPTLEPGPWSVWQGGVAPGLRAAAIAVGLLVLLFGAALMTAFNAAYAFAAFQRMAGRPCTRRRALRRALSQWGGILGFSLIGLLAGFAFSLVGHLADRFRFLPGVGRVANTVGSLAFAVAAYFVVPIIVVEREGNGWRALRRSASLAYDMWGGSMAGIVTISLVLLVPAVLLLPVFVIGSTVGFVLLLPGGSFALVSTISLCALFLLLGVLLVLSTTLQTAYQTALYRFARTGEIAPPFDVEAVYTVWEPLRAG